MGIAQRIARQLCEQTKDMWHRSSLSTRLPLGAIVVALTACSSSMPRTIAETTRSTAESRTNTTALATTSTPVAPTTTAQTPAKPIAAKAGWHPPAAPYSFADSLPEPPLPQPGDSPRAAFWKLQQYTDWLYAYNPDPSLVDKIAFPGTKTNIDTKSELRQLRDTKRRMFDVDPNYKISRIQIDERLGPIIWIRTTTLEARIVNENQTLSSIWRTPKGTQFNANLTKYNGYWQFADVHEWGFLPRIIERQ